MTPRPLDAWAWWVRFKLAPPSVAFYLRALLLEVCWIAHDHALRDEGDA